MNRFYWLILILASAIVSCDTKDSVLPRSEEFFIKMYEGVAEGDQIGADIIETSDGGLLVGGKSENSDGSVEMIVVKTDRFGNTEWTFGGNSIFGSDTTSEVRTLLEVPSGFVIGGVINDGTTNRSVLLKLAADGSWGATPSDSLFLTTSLNGVNYNNEISKITLGASGLLVSGNTDRPYNHPTLGPVGGVNIFMGLVNSSDLSQVFIGGKAVYYYGLEGDDFTCGTYEVRDQQTNINPAKNVKFLVFGSTDNKNIGQQKDFFYYGFNETFTPVEGSLIEDSGADQTANNVVEYNDTYWMIGNSDESQIFMIGWKYQGNPTGIPDWIQIVGTGEVNTTESAIGTGIAIQGVNDYVITGDMIFSIDVHIEIFLSGLDFNYQIKPGWPRYFGTPSSTYKSANVIVLQDGSIVTVGTADLKPIRKIVVVKTGPNGEMSF